MSSERHLGPSADSFNHDDFQSRLDPPAPARFSPSRDDPGFTRRQTQGSPSNFDSIYDSYFASSGTSNNGQTHSAGGRKSEMTNSFIGTSKRKLPPGAMPPAPSAAAIPMTPVPAAMASENGRLAGAPRDPASPRKPFVPGVVGPGIDRDLEIQKSPDPSSGYHAYEDAASDFSGSEDPASGAKSPPHHATYASTVSSSGGHARLVVPGSSPGLGVGGRPGAPARTMTSVSSRSGFTAATSTAGFGGPAAGGAPPPSLWKRLIPSSNVQRAFLAVVLIETALDVGIMADLLYRYNLLVDDDSGSDGSRTITTSTLPVYLVIFLLAHLFQLCVAVYSTISRNTIQLVGLLIFNALFLAYAVLQTSEIREAFNIQLDDASTRENGIPPNSIFRVPISVLTYLIIGMIALAQACYIPLTYLLYKEFGWDVYHDFGASLAIRRYHFHHQIYSCLLLFTSFFFSGFSIQLIFLSLDRSSPEFYVTCVLWPISMLILALGLWSAWKENRPAMGAFIVGMLAAAGYFIYKTVRLWKERTMAEFATDYKSLTVFSSLSLAILALTTVAGGIIMSHFGKGLRERRLKRKERRRQQAAAAASEKDGNLELTGHELDVKSPHRMSID